MRQGSAHEHCERAAQTKKNSSPEVRTPASTKVETKQKEIKSGVTMNG